MHQNHEIIPVQVVTLVEDPKIPVIFLYCQGENKFLQIVIGKPESKILALSLEKAEFDRPLTHNLLLESVGALGGSLKRVVVYDLAGTTFHAKLCLQRPGNPDNQEEIQIECRPSDAIILAILNTKPIFVTRMVLQKAGVPNPLPYQPTPKKPLTEGEIQKIKNILQKAQDMEQQNPS